MKVHVYLLVVLYVLINSLPLKIKIINNEFKTYFNNRSISY